MSVRALIVGFDAPSTHKLSHLLVNAGYDVVDARTGTEGIHVCSELILPAIVLVAEEVENVTSTALCRHLRQDERTCQLPIVVLSAQGTDIDRIVAFELGVDDYIVTPYDERELLLRLRAILRRCYPNQDGAIEICAGPLALDREGHRVRLNGSTLNLTKVEFRLLEVLMSRRGRGQSRKRLLEDVWGRNGDESLRTVDTHIRRLRMKLGEASKFIQTVRGVGYRFGEREEHDS